MNKKGEFEVLKPIGKTQTNPTISKIKLATKANVEEILKSKLSFQCEQCNEKIVLVRIDFIIARNIEGIRR